MEGLPVLMLKRRGKRGHPCLGPDLRGKDISFALVLPQAAKEMNKEEQVRVTDSEGCRTDL